MPRFGLPLLLFLLSACGFGGGGVTPVRTAFNKGAYHYAAGDYDEAIAEYRSALEEDEADHRSRFNLAVALEAKAADVEERGDPAAGGSALRGEAEGEYRRLVEQRPDDLRASVNLASCEWRQGAREEAKARLRAAIERHADSALPRAALAAHLLAEGSPPARGEAIELLQAAVKGSPASVEANMLLGDALAAEGDLDAARKAYERALKREPSDIATLLALGRLEMRRGDRAAAGTWLQRVLHIDPDHLEAHQLLAGVLEAEGDLEGAVRHLWTARRLDHGDHGGRPGISASEYSRRLLDLYQRLAEREKNPASP